MELFQSQTKDKVSGDGLNSEDRLCRVVYYDYEYQGDWDMFYLESRDDPSTNIDSTWDEYFVEELTYNPRTGKATYKKGDRSVTATCKPMTKKFVRIKIGTYGWWTGHYTKMQSFSAEFR